MPLAQAALKTLQARVMGTAASGCQTMVLYRCGNAIRILNFSAPALGFCACRAYAGDARCPCQDSVFPGEIAIWIACVI